MSKILKQAEGQLMRTEALITNNGEPNIERIRRFDMYICLFSSIDLQIVWKQKVVYTKQDFFKSVFQVFLGIAMLTFLAGPLMENILQLSNAMNFPSFIISFVVVPIAMNARAAIAALLPASKKREDTASLTFSEIYGGVIMNNIAGLTTLLAIVYAKDLTWDFSAEVLTILVVCAAIGTQAFLSTTYHLWTCIPAFLLYPISLGFFYVFQAFFN
ncbi:sodium/calcium exchanger family protein / calcium-binding EF hand family protein [Perilla frutescens var. frutescens]|nr:sodium/calcium exchanger family protein / calcium-binding EF hand family protein [Perilla frutescens var. frutescens]